MQKHYGVVEGFFSEPLPYWTQRERLKTLDFIHTHCPRVNTYFYAPKSDPWVVAHPLRMYPKEKVRQLQHAVKRCKQYDLTFVYGFNPPFVLNAVESAFDGYIDSILRKIRQLHAVGVRYFCILYDEIPFALNFDEAKLRSTHDMRIGDIHARVMNTLRQRLSGEIDGLWFCPPDYSFSRTTPYLTALFARMDISIPILWTGNSIFTKTISADLMRKARHIAGKERDIIFWDNYPVNDCPHPLGTFHIGAFNTQSSEARAALAGILINPMRECYANFIAYLTFESYLKNPDVFGRDTALDAAFRTLLGGGAQPYARLYKTFSDKNIADDEPRGYYRAFLEARSADVARINEALGRDLAALRPPRASAGRSFVRTTKSILKRARDIHTIFSRMLLERGWERRFLSADVFPVTLDKKYLTRQFTVLLKRIALADTLNGERSALISALAKMRKDNHFSLPRQEPRTPLESNLLKLLRLFMTYRVENKLNITKADTRELVRIFRALIPFERHFFVQKIRHLPAGQKIKAFIRRSLMNAY